jgi:hypothetical protein
VTHFGEFSLQMVKKILISFRFCRAARILYGDNLMMETAALRACLSTFTKKVFFCGLDSEDHRPIVYASDTSARLELSRIFDQKAKEDPSFAQIKIKTTRSLQLEKTRSLEEMLACMPHGHIIFDPTATVERARALVKINKQARKLVGPTLLGCYFNSEKRNIHFLVRKQSAHTPALTAIKDLVEPILLENTQQLSKPFSYSITLSTEKPRGKVIAVDHASVIKSNVKQLLKTVFNKLKWPLLIASASSGLGMTSAVNASLPAVSETNGWLGISAGDFHNQRNSGGGIGGEGVIDQPLGHFLGAQARSYYGSIAHNSVVEIDGYVFWRDPDQGLIGPHVMYTETDNMYQTLYGAHGEAYLNNITVIGEGGGAHQNTRDWSGYGEAIVHWYIKPDWKIHAGYLRLNSSNAGQVGTEYQLGLSSLPGLSVFADVGAGTGDMRYGFLGLRYYFGETKSLMRRHREDNIPPTLDLLLASNHQNTMAPRFHS